MSRFLPLLLIFATAAHLLHRRVDTIPLTEPGDPHETLPSIEALRLLSLGYPELLADYYWLRAISHYGDREMHGRNYPNLEPLLRRVVALDPYFASAYVFAGTALTTNDMDPHPAVEILELGVQRRPDVWRIPFLLGFDAYYFLGDYLTAGKALAQAALLPGAPPYTANLAARLAAEAGEPEIGIKLVETLLSEISDPQIQQQLLERRTLLILELQLKQLDRALDTFARAAGHRAQSFQELLDHRPPLLRALPTDPLGGAYFIDARGRTATPNEARRLRLAPEAKRR